jgi:alkylhydroperoxidase family enzyme
MLQVFLVVLIVAVASLYAGWALLPASLRRAGAAWLATGARRGGLASARAERLQTRLSSGGGCSSCSSCQACAKPPVKRADGLQPVQMPPSRSARHTG